MNSRTWNLKLMATDNHPEATIEVAQNDAARILRGLMYGPGSADYAHVQAAFETVSADRHEGALAA